MTSITTTFTHLPSNPCYYMSKKEDIEASDMGIPIRGVWLMNSVCHLYHGVKMGLKLVLEKRESMGKKKKRRRRRRTKGSGKGEEK